MATYTDDGKHFWNLAIRTDAGYTKEDLWQESILYIEDKMHKNKLLETLNDVKGISAKDNGDSITIRFY